MIRLWAVFLLFAIGIHFSIISWRALSGKEKWTLTKTLAYSIIVSLLAVAVMMLIVLLF